MEPEHRTGLSPAAVVAIVCNSVAAVLIFILFIILYKACQVPSHPEKALALVMTREKQKTEEKYLASAT